MRSFQAHSAPDVQAGQTMRHVALSRPISDTIPLPLATSSTNYSVRDETSAGFAAIEQQGAATQEISRSVSRSCPARSMLLKTSPSSARLP